MKKFIFILFVVALLVTPSIVKAEDLLMDIVLEWDANSEPDLAGYKAYWGLASGSYFQSKGSGVETGTTTFTVTNLNYGTKYFFAVTAFDTEGNESEYSNEVWADGISDAAPIPPNALKPVRIKVKRPDGTVVTVIVP